MITGFSKLDRAHKIIQLKETLQLSDEQTGLLDEFFSFNEDLQKRFEGFSENVISSYPFPFSVAPNFLINGKLVHVPMVIEESSVVAAASYAARFWAKHGGFLCTVNDTQKVGQVFFRIKDSYEVVSGKMDEISRLLSEAIKPFTGSMESRGGGLLGMKLIDFTKELTDVFCLQVTFETVDSMGANFINTCLEAMANELKVYVKQSADLNSEGFEIVMAILSNYTPDCTITCTVKCKVDDLAPLTSGLDARVFAERFVKAVQIAEVDTFRATTHNKGIYNGISAVLLATANDFRAVEAAGHAYAARDGVYKSLSHAGINGDEFSFSLEVPLAVGTVGGLTKIHPMANLAFEILDQPSARELMMIIAAAGLANNFAAVRSLTTTGIQAGHMKMHLNNILQFEGVTPEENRQVIAHFSDKTVTYTGVKQYLDQIRNSG